MIVEPPVITQPPMNTTVLEGATVHFTCAAIGMPAPNIHWTALKNGVSVTINSNLYNISDITENQTVSILNLFKVTPAIAGTYTCIVNNTIGMDTRSAQLIVYSKLMKTILKFSYYMN